MILLPTFNFTGTVLPILNKTDKIYLLVENNNKHRVLLNVVSTDINRFINIDSELTKTIYCGIYKPNLHLKIFYLGQELFDFNCNELAKQSFLSYSDYILKNMINTDEILFHPTFIDGFELSSVSNKPQNLFIKIVDGDKNEILHEDNFLSGEPYTFKQTGFINYQIFVYNVYGQKIYSYDLNLKDKRVWIKLENNSSVESVVCIPYIEEFRKKHQCEVLCTACWNSPFIAEYPNIKFVSSNEKIELDSLFAVYKVKCTDQNEIPQKIVSKSLGLEYKEIKLNNVLEHIKKISTSNTI